jgi:hypothetical protein
MISGVVSGMGNVLSHRLSRLLEILGHIHGGSLHLLGFSLDLVPFVTGKVANGGFQSAFGIFCRGVNVVGHGDDRNGNKDDRLTHIKGVRRSSYI